MIYTNTPARRGSNEVRGLRSSNRDTEALVEAMRLTETSSGGASSELPSSADSAVDILIEQLQIFDTISKTPPQIIEIGARESKDDYTTESTEIPPEPSSIPAEPVIVSAEPDNPAAEPTAPTTEPDKPEVSCAICLESGINLKVFVPCGHTVCVGCDESLESRLERCHICTAAIEKKIRLYL
jgi:hypothetical protein